METIELKTIVTESESICDICWDPITTEDSIHFRCCNQELHLKCFLEWTISKRHNVKCIICHKDYQGIIKELVPLDQLFNHITLTDQNDRYVHSLIRHEYTGNHYHVSEESENPEPPRLFNREDRRVLTRALTIFGGIMLGSIIIIVILLLVL